MKDQNNISKEEKKILANYDNAMAKAFSLLKGKSFKPITKIPSSDITELMEEFFGDKIKAKKEEFKIKFGELLEEKIEFDKFIKSKEYEFKKVMLDKKKEFTNKINSVASIIEGIDIMKQEYLDSLTPSSVIED